MYNVRPSPPSFMTTLQYYHGNALFSEAEIVHYSPPRSFQLETGTGSARSTETQVAPSRLTLRLSVPPQKREDVYLSNAKGERIQVEVEHVEGDNRVTVTGLFDDSFISAK
jgi:hypothetical protein